MKRIAIIGSQGIPSKYGGFETLVEYLAEYLSGRFEITVFCSSKDYSERLNVYKGCKLEYIHFSANGIQSIPYDIISILKARNFDKVLILGVSGGIIIPFLKNYQDKFILNFGGLDWNRDKWSTLTKKFLKFSERLAIKNSKFLISDNEGIKNYISSNYNRDSKLIAYGGDQVKPVAPGGEDYQKYPFLSEPFAFSVARIQADNNIEMILEAFMGDIKVPIVFVGNWKNSEFGLEVKKKFSDKENIVLLDAIYDQRELNVLRSNCKYYIHGHSAGGTNPALVEAMNLHLPIFAFSSGFNEFTTDQKAQYFSEASGLKSLIQNTDNATLEKIGKDMKEIALQRYQWKMITDKYAEVFEE